MVKKKTVTPKWWEKLDQKALAVIVAEVIKGILERWK